MGKDFDREINHYGVLEPLLFLIKRTDQEPIHLARLLKDFFEFEDGKCSFSKFTGGIKMQWTSKSSKNEKWTFSKDQGLNFPNEARSKSDLTLKDAELVKSFTKFIGRFMGAVVDLDQIIGIGGEGTVLKYSQVSKRKSTRGLW